MRLTVNRIVGGGVVIVGLVAAVVAGASGASGRVEKAPPRLKITFISGLAGIPFYGAMACGVNDAAKRLTNVSVTVQGPSDFAVTKQLPIIEAVEQTHPSG